MAFGTTANSVRCSAGDLIVSCKVNCAWIWKGGEEEGRIVIETSTRWQTRIGIRQISSDKTTNQEVVSFSTSVVRMS